MQRSEEKIDANTPKLAPKIEHQSGNVNVFVIGTLMAIAAMWLVFQHDAEGTPTIAAEHSATAVSSLEPLHAVVISQRNHIDEVVVTAPRLTEQSERFERPKKEIALAAPTAPKTYWQRAS